MLRLVATRRPALCCTASSRSRLYLGGAGAAEPDPTGAGGTVVEVVAVDAGVAESSSKLA